MLTPEQIEECARAASKHSATLGKDDVLAWMTRGEYLRLARAIEAATLATVTPLVQQLVDGLEYHMLQTRPIAKTEKMLAEARALLGGLR